MFMTAMPACSRLLVATSTVYSSKRGTLKIGLARTVCGFVRGYVVRYNVVHYTFTVAFHYMLPAGSLYGL